MGAVGPGDSVGGTIRVAVSLVGLGQPRTTGLERYGIELVRALRRYAPRDVAVLPVAHRWAAERLGGPCAVVPDRLPRPAAMEAWLPRWLSRARPDLLHVVPFGAPALGRTPFVLTVHDMVPWDLPEALSRGNRWYFRPTVERSLASPWLRAVVSHAEWTAAEVARRWHLAVPCRGIGVGLTDEWFAGPSGPREPGPLRLLTVGTLEPRKGLHEVAVAARLLAERGVQVEWSLAGRQGWGGVDVPPGVRPLGPIDDERLRQEYRRADVVVAPSHAEGFDLPVAEGLAAGCEVVASDLPVHRELFDGLATFVPVADGAALASAVEARAASVTDEVQARSVTDEECSHGRDARSSAAHRFGWERTVAELVTVWRAAVG